MNCRNCGRRIVHDPSGYWIDPEAPVDTDDVIWREQCDASTSFNSVHEPALHGLTERDLELIEVALESAVAATTGSDSVSELRDEYQHALTRVQVLRDEES